MHGSCIKIKQYDEFASWGLGLIARFTCYYSDWIRTFLQAL